MYKLCTLSWYANQIGRGESKIAMWKEDRTPKRTSQALRGNDDKSFNDDPVIRTICKFPVRSADRTTKLMEFGFHRLTYTYWIAPSGSLHVQSCIHCIFNNHEDSDFTNFNDIMKRLKSVPGRYHFNPIFISIIWKYLLTMNGNFLCCNSRWAIHRGPVSPPSQPFKALPLKFAKPESLKHVHVHTRSSTGSDLGFD